jgi:hypothetical protein
MSFKPDDRVQWRWGSGTGEGVVRGVFTDRVEREIKGSTIVRNADEDNPAYLVEQEDGSVVLKSHSELDGA